jgi:hypothetical protein
MFFNFRKKKPEEPHAQYRIVKYEYSEYDDDRVQNRVTFSIEEWTSYYTSENPFWCGMYLNNGTPNTFKTHEEASQYLTRMLKPIPKPIQTVVEERYL